MFISESLIRVRYSETDQMGVVYHSNFFPYFESARAESIRELGFTYKDMEKMDVIMPVTEVHCSYLRPALYDDLLTVKVILKELPLKHKIEFHHEVFNEKKQLLATARIVLYFMDAKTRKPVSMPEPLMKTFQPYFS